MDMQRSLAVIRAAALEAGKVISDHFYQAGGPQGHDGHCVADEEAERIIRRHLQLHLPECSIIGEELGSLDRLEKGEYLILVDPNDGTSAFLGGFRGSAVSIGLLRNGIPILGVVYAPTARAGFGDLICWYEGGPLTRNGAVIAESLPATGVVGVSQAADRASNVNQSLCGSYRFLSVASIAYRLALTAVGEIDAGLSLASPVSWDVAAGTALLRARGNTVMGKASEHGSLQVLQHDPKNGEIQSIWACMGGTPSTVKALLAQPWEEIYRKNGEREAEWGLCWPDPQQIVGDSRLLNAGQGLLMGLLAGDALGAGVEFQHRDDIADVNLEHLQDGGVWNLMAGQITDDGELAMMLGRSLLRAGGYDPETALDAYLYWYRSDPFDIGNTTKVALSAGVNKSGSDRIRSVRQAARATESQSNGALMRIAPMALWGFRKDLDLLADVARMDAELTHAHPVCVDANRVFIVTLVLLLRGVPPMEAYQQTIQWAGSARVEPAILSVLKNAAQSLPEDAYSKQGWVLLSLHIAYYQLLHATDLAEGIRDAVRQGGDTDTNAAITGALLGACFGANALPAQWTRAILSARPIAGMSKTAHPRPKAFWLVDALIVAERLLSMDAPL
ncbi:ADP-ribosylation/Crystallin J1 [Acidithiobacillus ferrivorans]|nr:ADP-ribosylation/Crystallin J1 [Acidithiobacillus ferrivorans]